MRLGRFAALRGVATGTRAECRGAFGAIRPIRDHLVLSTSLEYEHEHMQPAASWLDLERWRRLATRPQRIPLGALERLMRWSARVPAVRRLRREAVAPLVRVHSASFDAPELRSWEARGWLRPGEAARLNAAAEPDGRPRIIFVATLGSWKVGRNALSSMWRHLEIPGVWVAGIVVSPLVRGCGVGTRLLEEVLRQAERLPGVEELWANIRSTNEASLGLFRSFGFEVVSKPDWEERIAEHYVKCGRAPGIRDVIVRRPLAKRRSP